LKAPAENGCFLTDDELRQRDLTVWDMTARYRIAVAWNLAGGYRHDSVGTIEPVLRIHRASAQSLCTYVTNDTRAAYMGPLRGGFAWKRRRLRNELLRRALPARGEFRRQDPQGREAGRHRVRAGHQARVSSST